MRGLTRDGLLLVGILLAMVAATALFVHLPAHRALAAIRSDIATEELSLAAKAQKAGVVPELQRQVNRMRSRHADFHRRLPPRQELGEFLRQITEALAVENLSNPVIEPGQPAPSEHFHTLPIVLRFQGSFRGLANLLERIDRIERLTRVEKLSVTGKPGADLLDVTMQLHIYFAEG